MTRLEQLNEKAHEVADEDQIKRVDRVECRMYSQCALVGNISIGPRRCRFPRSTTVQCFVWIQSADMHVNLGSHHRSHKKEPNTPPLGTSSASSRFCDRRRCENVSRRCERLCMKIAILLNQAWMCLHVKQQQLENGIRQLTQCHGMHVIMLSLLCSAYESGSVSFHMLHASVWFLNNYDPVGEADKSLHCCTPRFIIFQIYL